MEYVAETNIQNYFLRSQTLSLLVFQSGENPEYFEMREARPKQFLA